MTQHEIGYCKPPKAYRFQKGQSGNRKGRPKKLQPTLAKLIEDAWLAPIAVSDGSAPRQSSGFELIVLGLLAKIADGSVKAHRVFRKYEAFAKTKPRIITQVWDKEWALAAYIAGRDGREYPPPRKLRPPPKTSGERTIKVRIARMRSGMEPPMPMEGMTARESMEMYLLSLKQPVQQLRPEARRRTTGKLTAGEILQNAISSPVKLNDGKSAVTLARLTASIKILLMKAARGNIGCADMLAIMHAYSLEHGDFFAPIRYESITV